MDLPTNTTTNTLSYAQVVDPKVVETKEEDLSNIIQTNVIGCVKWFNPKVGYGFITNLDTNGDVFAHHSNIKSETNTFRYLVQGEYVQFNLSYVSHENRSVHAITITGVRGGRLLCDVHSSQQMFSSPIPGYSHSKPNQTTELPKHPHTPEDGDEPFRKHTNKRRGPSEHSHYRGSRSDATSNDKEHRPYRLPRSDITKYNP